MPEQCSLRPVLTLCWLTTSASTMAMGLPIGVRRFGRRHGDECVLPIVVMLDATTIWESKCPGATSRSFRVCLQTVYWASSLVCSATTSRPLLESWRGTYATPLRCLLWQFIHPRTHCDQGHVGWCSVCAFQDAQLQLRAHDLFQALTWQSNCGT